jgi:hypothetical protein
MERILVSHTRHSLAALSDSIICHRGSRGHDESKWLHSIVRRASERFLLFCQTAENFPPARNHWDETSGLSDFPVWSALPVSLAIYGGESVNVCSPRVPLPMSFAQTRLVVKLLGGAHHVKMEGATGVRKCRRRVVT